jgi:hypothetical protein
MNEQTMEIKIVSTIIISLITFVFTFAGSLCGLFLRSMGGI